MTEMLKRPAVPAGLGHLKLRILRRRSGQVLNLFRASIFGFSIWLFVAEGSKSSPSIIRPTCVIDAKKVLDSRSPILVTRCGKVS